MDASDHQLLRASAFAAAANPDFGAAGSLSAADIQTALSALQLQQTLQAGGNIIDAPSFLSQLPSLQSPAGGGHQHHSGSSWSSFSGSYATTASPGGGYHGAAGGGGGGAGGNFYARQNLNNAWQTPPASPAACSFASPSRTSSNASSMAGYGTPGRGEGRGPLGRGRPVGPRWPETLTHCQNDGMLFLRKAAGNALMAPALHGSTSAQHTPGTRSCTPGPHFQPIGVERCR